MDGRPKSQAFGKALGPEFNVKNRLALLSSILLLASFVVAQSPGETLFTQHCVACHGTDLSGRTNFGKRANIPDLKTATVQSRSDGDLLASIGRGEGHKEYPHGFLSRGLNQVQVKNIIAYIRSLSTVAKK
jgi:mono/diheme cytochrome c family protein